MSAGGEAHEADWRGAQVDGVDANLAERVDCFGAEEFAADFVMRGALFLEDSDAAAGSGKADCDH